MKLSKELLLNNGFCTTDYGNVYRYVYDDKNIHVEVEYDYFDIWSVNINYYDSSDELYKTIKTVEDLQKCLDLMEVPLKIKIE